MLWRLDLFSSSEVDNVPMCQYLIHAGMQKRVCVIGVDCRIGDCIG